MCKKLFKQKESGHLTPMQHLSVVVPEGRTPDENLSFLFLSGRTEIGLSSSRADRD